MIRSMTGYGRKEIAANNTRATIEIRSVNNRYLDIQVKTPRSLAALEPRIKKTVQDRCARGRIDVFVSRNEDRDTSGRITVDAPLLEQYLETIKTIKQRYNLAGEADVALVAGFPGLISVAEEKEDLDATWSALLPGLTEALAGLDAMRGSEGQAMVADMIRRLDTIESLMQSIQTLAPATVEQARKRMSDALAKLLTEQPDPVRLAQEIAILAERTDVTEELTRLQSHIRQFRTMVSQAATEPVGRKFDFLLQEMGREANTIASKAMNAQIAYHVVDIKAELEKIREQVQNIE